MKHTYEEPMPWMSEPCPYGALGCGCHLGSKATGECEELRYLVNRKRLADSYERHLELLDRPHVTPRPVDFEVDMSPPRVTLWQRLKLLWRFFW